MSHPENKLNIRRARPQTLAGAVGGLMQLFGRRASDADLVARWDEIMGADIAALARPGVLRPTRDKQFNVSVRAANPACALELSYRLDDIRRKIDKYFGYAAVAKITIRK